MSDANDPEAQRRAALVRAADLLVPEIRGLRGLLRIIDRGPLQDQLMSALERVDSRHTLIVRAIGHYDSFTDAFDRLERDGYPTPLPPFSLPSELSSQLQEAIAAVEAAAGIFRAEEANEIFLNVAGDVVTEQPAPTEPGP